MCRRAKRAPIACSTLLLGAPLQPSVRTELLTLLGHDLPEQESMTILLAVLLASPAFQWR